MLLGSCGEMISLADKTRHVSELCLSTDSLWLLQIVVHGLPWSAEWQDLKDLAKQYGDAVKADIAKRSDGKSRGFGTIVFKTPEDAQTAIQVCLCPGLSSCV